jgi:protein-tyrosine-phosphatase
VALAGPGEDRKSVLFACTLNCIRSPIAAAILDHLAGGRVAVMSAGVRAGLPDPYAVAVMDEIGIDLSEHEPQSLAIIGDRLFDVIISLSPEAHHHALELTRTMAAEVEYWPTMDCSLALSQPKREHIITAYRGVRDDLFERIRVRFALDGGPTV